MRGNHWLVIGLLLALFLAGCASPAKQATPVEVPSTPSAAPSTPTAAPPEEPPAAPSAPACTTKDCFITAANDCQDLTMTLTEDAGAFTYVSSSGCVFTKTLVSLSAEETQEMKNLLQGKSLTCRHEKGKFNPDWANSLLSGIEHCEGELKEILAQLLLFG